MGHALCSQGISNDHHTYPNSIGAAVGRWEWECGVGSGSGRRGGRVSGWGWVAGCAGWRGGRVGVVEQRKYSSFRIIELDVRVFFAHASIISDIQFLIYSTSQICHEIPNSPTSRLVNIILELLRFLLNGSVELPMIPLTLIT